MSFPAILLISILFGIFCGIVLFPIIGLIPSMLISGIVGWFLPQWLGPK